MAERLWLDDVRKPPWGYSLWAKTAEEAIRLLQAHEVEHCSLDHDLAEEHYGAVESEGPIDRSQYKELTGYAVLEWMHENNRWVGEINIHTLNRVAADDMLRMIRKHAPEHVEFKRVKPKEIGGIL